MKVLLISPLPVYQDTPKPCWLPLGLAYIAAVLRRHGHDVSIFDRHAARVRIGADPGRINSAMLERIRRFRPDLVGLQTVSPLIYDTVECARLIRRSYSGLMVAGGHHASALPELCLAKIPGLNGVVVGEGETAVAAIANGDSPARVPGLWWKGEDGHITSAPPEQLEDLDELPFPALDLLDMAYYTRPTVNTIRGHYLSTVSLITSRGCTRRCEFCAESLTYGKGVRFNSPEYVMEWIRKVLTDYRVEGIYFHDNDFLIDEERAREICERMISSGLHRRLKWAIQARADRMNSRILGLLKRAGCVLIEIGVESSSQDQLNAINKGADAPRIAEAVSLCRRKGISVHAYMMTGFKGELISDLEQNLHWLKRVKPDSFTWSPMKIYPGTVLYNSNKIRFFEENDWDEPRVKSYYQEDHLSLISPEERLEWNERYLWPYQARRRRLHIFRVNSLFKLISLIHAERRELPKRLLPFLKRRVKNIDRVLLKRE